MYKVGYDLVQTNMLLEIDPPNTRLSPKDFLRYFYYAGICCIGMRDFTAAMENLTVAYAMPGHAVSFISVCAFKKATLLSLILTGKKLQPPQYAVASASKIEKHAKEYEAIASCYVSKDFALLRKALMDNDKVLSEDENTGLAKKLFESLLRQRIKEISCTYITLSIQDIVTQLEVRIPI